LLSQANKLIVGANSRFRTAASTRRCHRKTEPAYLEAIAAELAANGAEAGPGSIYRVAVLKMDQPARHRQVSRQGGLSSDPTLSKSFSDTTDITIGINGWAYGTGSSVWYSQDSYGNTLTANGTATITAQTDPTLGETPVPAALPLFASGLGALGLFGWRRKRRAQAAA
jgi:PEP-CTERM motif-containing protein